MDLPFQLGSFAFGPPTLYLVFPPSVQRVGISHPPRHVIQVLHGGFGFSLPFWSIFSSGLVWFGPQIGLKF